MSSQAIAQRRIEQTASAASGRLLLIDEGWAQTFDLARALDCAGYTVTVMTANGTGASHRRGAVVWCSLPRVASRDFLPALDAAIRQQRFDHVLPLTEPVMARLWDARPVWSARIHPRTESWQRRLLRSKHRLIDHMRARGIDVPAQVWIDASFDPREIGRELGLPLVLKEATGSAGARVCIVESRRALERAVVRARRLGGSWVAQEWVPGSTYLLGGVFHDGRPLRLYAAEKLEQYPARTGPAIRLRSDDDRALVDGGLRVFRELRWTGIASADLMRRPDGSPVLLEVNPRPWGSIAAARAADVDLFTALAELLAGRVPAADLTFAPNREHLVFPRYLLSPAYRTVRGLLRAIQDLCGRQGLDWHPRFLRHNLIRLNGLRHQR